MRTVSSSASAVDGGALLRLAWMILVGAIALVLKKDLEKKDLGPLRSWLREKLFELLLIGSHPSPLADGAARVLRSWLSRLPGISEDQLRILDPSEHKHFLRQEVVCALGILWGAWTEARRADRTLQFGMWIRLVGVATVGLGVQFVLAGEAWGLILMESALGIILLGVGHFLGALRCRRWLSGALLLLGPAAVALDARFAVTGPGGPVREVVEVLRQLGSVAAAIACLQVAVAIRASSVRHGDEVPPRIQRRKEFLIRWGMRSAGVACLCYSMANLTQGFMVAPTMIVQATHLFIAVCLAMAASESRHPASSYGRLTSG